MMAKEKTGKNPVIPQASMTFSEKDNLSTRKSENLTPNMGENANSNSSEDNKNKCSHYRNPAIDGLRALAIIGIVAFHLRPAMLQGGFLGVTLFLVLAGYFSTISLLHIYSRDLHIHYFKYLWNRIKRIWPSTLGTIALSAPILWLFAPSLLPKLQSDALSGAGFFSNMAYILRKVSYFDEAGLPSPIKHLWYLGLIMQAFVIWPIILWALIKLVHSKFIRIGITALLTIASVITTAAITFMHGNGMTIARVYYSLDTRGSEFLIGALLAMYSIWFSKGSIRGLVADTFTYVLSNKENKREILSQENAYSGEDLKQSNKLENSRNVSNGNSSINSEDKFNSSYKFNNAEYNIPQDLRAGLQIDFSDSNSENNPNNVSGDAYSDSYSSETDNSYAKSEIKELPENIFNNTKKLTHTFTPLASWIRSIIGLLSIVVLIVGYVYADSMSYWLNYGGYTLIAIVSSIALWACCQKDNLCYKILGLAPFKYLGKRSFALYLVHFPLLEIFNPATRTNLAPWWEQILQFLATVVVAECFYRIFEMPLVKRKFSLNTSNAVDANVNVSSKSVNLTSAARDLFIVVCAATTVALIVLPLNWKNIAHERAVQLRPELSAVARSSHQKSEHNQNNSNHSNKNGSANKTVAKRRFTGKLINIKKGKNPPIPAKQRILNPIAEKVPENLVTSTFKFDSKKDTCSAKIMMVGDSITEGAKPYILEVMPNAFVDGKVSRQIYQGADAFEKDLSEGHKGSAVVYALGTNGPPNNDSLLQHLVDVAHGKPVYFVTTRVPQPWQDATNAKLREFAATHKNVGIIDWHGLSNGHSEYLTDDGVHLTPIGGPKFARMIRLAVCGL